MFIQSNFLIRKIDLVINMMHGSGLSTFFY